MSLKSNSKFSAQNRKFVVWTKKILCLSRTTLRTTVPFATALLEIFHCTHHPVIPKSNLYFTFGSTLNVLKNIKVTINGLINGIGKWNEPQHASKLV